MRQMVAGLRWATLILVGSAVVAACQPGEDSATTDTGAAGDTGALGGTGAGGNTAVDASTLGTVMAVHASEVQMGELAQEKATNAQVRQFAQRIEQEHQNFVDRGRQLSPQPDTAQADRQLVQMADSTMQRLRNMARGAAFDTAFVNAQVAAHEAALQKLGGAAGGAGGQTGTPAAGDTAHGAAGTGASQNPSDWVNASRSAVQAHLQQARQLQQQLGGGQR